MDQIVKRAAELLEELADEDIMPELNCTKGLRDKAFRNLSKVEGVLRKEFAESSKTVLDRLLVAVRERRAARAARERAERGY